MYKSMIKFIKIDTVSMLLVYALNFLSEIAYIYIIWNTDYWMGENSFFIFLYSFMSGVMIVIDVILAIGAVNLLYNGALSSKNSFVNMPLLKIFSVTQTATVIADIVFAILYGGFWQDGYIYLLFELMTIVMYMRRYYVLKKLKELINDELQKEGVASWDRK